MKKYFATGKENEFIKVYVDYQKGGMNYFTHKDEPRGIYVSIQRETTNLDGMSFASESFMAFSGRKYVLLEQKRKSQKKTDEISALIEPIAEELAKMFLDSDWFGLSAKLMEIKKSA